MFAEITPESGYDITTIAGFLLTLAGLVIGLAKFHQIDRRKFEESLAKQNTERLQHESKRDDKYTSSYERVADMHRQTNKDLSEKHSEIVDRIVTQRREEHRDTTRAMDNMTQALNALSQHMSYQMGRQPPPPPPQPPPTNSDKMS